MTVMRARSGGAPAWLPLAASLAAGLVCVPIAYLFVRATEGGLADYLSAIATRRVLELVGRTTILAILVLMVAIAVALPAAWLVARTDLPGRRLWATLIAMPLVFPSYVAAFTWVSFFGPRGYLQTWLMPLGVQRLPEWIYGLSGSVVVLGLFTYPYLFLLLVSALKRSDPALEESSRTLGMSRAKTFRRIVLPQLRPALYGGSLLVVLYTLSDFGAVSILRFNTFTLSIYNAYRGLFDRSLAAALATVLILLTVAWIGLEARLSAGLRTPDRTTGRLAAPVALGAWRWPAFVALGLLGLLTLAVPIGVIGFWGVRALLIGKSLGSVGLGGLNSVTVSAAAALVALVLAIAPAVWSSRYKGVSSTVVERLCHAGYALPGMVIALAFVFMSTRYTRWAYQTLGLLIVAYVVRFLPQALAAVKSALANVPPALEEAGRSLGRSPAGVLRSVTLPLVTPGLLVGAALVFLTAMKELPATLILRPTGFETLATAIWAASSEGIYSEAALPALILVVVSALPVYLLVIRPVLEAR
jgi:iron(III) transport system permease protein